MCYHGFRVEIKDVPVERFLARFFERCKKYLTAELIRLRPTTVIDLGEPTHRLPASACKGRGWKDTGSRFSVLAGLKEVTDEQGVIPGDEVQSRRPE